MTWISHLFNRYWRNVHFISIALLSLLLLVGGGNVRGVVSSVLVQVFYSPFHIIKSTAVDLSMVNGENQRLHLKLAEVTTELGRLEELRRENSRLRAVLGFEPPSGYSMLPARVISVSGDRVPIAAVINRGTEDSIVVDLPLINEQGLIGKVVSVGPHTATVQLLTDPTHRVAVRVAESREMGIVKFRLDGGLILDNFPIQGTLAEGDLILSSGLGGIYPPGLVVGTVARVERPEEEPFCKIQLTPAASFNSLEELFILRAVAP
ncbi:MAG: rod shape-determining protein MreC [candidate division Zixibacteria bacterium]|nr:rod shape-determining protein MreC [candidate division Zixibacteria bacterium]